MPRKSKVVRDLEAQLEQAVGYQSYLQKQLHEQSQKHQEELTKVRVQVHEKRIELATKLINAIGQTQDSIARPLAMLLDSSGF